MHTTRRHFGSLLGLALLALPGCKKDNTASDTAAPTANVNGEGQDSDASPAEVHVDPAIRELCALPETSFAFNSSALTAKDSAVLDALAECFVSGPAKDERMQLVGHADPRGADDYNLALGQRRADSVASHLHERGLSSSRTDTSSRGELDATGTDESGWARDRRVDITLAEEG